MTPTLPASRGSLPPEGAAPSAAWQSQFRDGVVAPTLVASRTSLPPEGAAPSAAWLSQFRDGNLHGRGENETHPA